MYFVDKSLKGNKMSEALIVSLTPPTNSKRVFDFVQDHPHTTSTQVARALGMAQNNASSICSDLVKRQMFKEVSETGLDSIGTRRVLRYYSPCIKEYVILPRLMVNKTNRTKTSVALPLASSPAPIVVLPEATIEQQMAIFADTLPLKKARALYDYLSSMFTPRS